MIDSINPFFSSSYASASIGTLFAALPSSTPDAKTASAATTAATLQTGAPAGAGKATTASSSAMGAILQLTLGGSQSSQAASSAASAYAEAGVDQAGDVSSAQNAPSSGQPAWLAARIAEFYSGTAYPDSLKYHMEHPSENGPPERIAAQAKAFANKSFVFTPVDDVPGLNFKGNEIKIYNTKGEVVGSSISCTLDVNALENVFQNRCLVCDNPDGQSLIASY